MKIKKGNQFAWYIDVDDDDRHFECPYKKIIFLDIDGVLNVEEDDEMGTIRMEKVNLLKSIVDQTGANIIMCSSWKFGYNKFVENGCKGIDPAYERLYDSLNQVGLKIDGITPESPVTGTTKKPLEIREWLRVFHDIFSFVILDDDTMTQWGYLQRNVVTTLTYYPDAPFVKRYKTGLTEEHVKKAIEILNDAGALEIE